MVSMKQILSSIILLLVCANLLAFSMLHPGDIVKGKKITKTYYCLTDAEMRDMTLKLHNLQTLETMNERRAAVEDAQQRFAEMVSSSSFTLQSKVKELETAAISGTAREKRLAELVKIEQGNARRERRGRKRDRWMGWIREIAIGGIAVWQAVK